MNKGQAISSGITDLDDFLNSKMPEVEKQKTDAAKDSGKKQPQKQDFAPVVNQSGLEKLFQVVGEYESISTAISKDHARRLQFLSSYSDIFLSKHVSVRKLLHNILSDFFEQHASELRALEDEFRKSERLF